MISIIMGIYNCADTLEDAVLSIINQTVSDWELIMCDDGSTDNTFSVARKLADKDTRIVLIQNPQNMGLNYTLNRCLALAKGAYIARMDGDDLCAPDRLQKEMVVLNQNPGISIVSTDMVFFDKNGIWGKTDVKKYPQPIDFLKETQFCHAACLVRKEAYQAVGGYSVDDRFLRVEDYHLWVKMYVAGYRGMNIQEPLYQMRDDRNAIKRKKFKYRINEAYVKTIAVKSFGLPKWNYVYCLKPIMIGLIPSGVYTYLHRITRPVKER